MWKSKCLLIILIVCMWPSLWSQHTSFDLSFSNESLSQIFTHIQQEYEVDFAFDPLKMNDIILSGKIQAANLEVLLEQLLQKSGYTFEFLSPKEVLILPAAPPKEQFARLQGWVVDAKSGEPLPFASVWIPSLKKGVRSDEKGRFSFSNLPQQQLELNFSFIGYSDKKEAVQLPTQSSLRVALIQEKISLDEVVIALGSEQSLHVADAPGKIQINPEKIANLSGLGEPDMLKAIQLLPGIKGTNVASSGFYIRGGTPDQNLVLFDGITAYRVDHFFGLFSAFNTRAIQAVDIYRGGFDARYGGRVSGVVDIKGKAADYDKVHASIGANLFSSHLHLELPMLNKKASLLLSGRRSYSDVLNHPLYEGLLNYIAAPPEVSPGYNSFQRSSISIDEAYSENPKIEFNLNEVSHAANNPNVEYYDLNTQLRYLTVNEDVFRNSSDPDFQFQDLNGKFNLQLSRKDLVSLTYYQGGDKLLYSYDQQTFNRREIQSIDKLKLQNQGMSSSWFRQWNNNLYSKLNFSWSSFGSLYEYGFVGKDDTSKYSTFIDQRNSIQDYAMRAENSWQIDAKNKFEFGTEFSQKSILFQFNSDTVLLGNNQTGATLATFAQHTFHPEPNLAMRMGLRSTYHQRTDKWYFDPRLSLDYQLSDRLYMKGAWGVYHQFVNRVQINNGLGLGEEFWALADGRDIPVQMSNHLIFGATYESPSFLVELEAYHKYTEGIITYSFGFAPEELIDKGEESLLSGGQTTVRGIDILIQKKWNDFYTGWVSYSLSKVNEKFLGINLGEFYPALHDQRHELKLVNQLQIDNFDLAATWIFSSGRPYTQAEETRSVLLPDGSSSLGLGLGGINANRLPNYHRLDVSLSYQFAIGKAKSQIGFSVYNFYNRSNVRSRRYFLDSSNFLSIRPTVKTSDVLDLSFSPNIFFKVSF